MIQVDQLIQYMRTMLPAYKVGGAAELKAARDNSRIMVENTQIVPALFLRLRSFIAFPESESSLLEKTDERIEILLCCKQFDRTGQSAQQMAFWTRLAIYKALLNFQAGVTNIHADGLPNRNDDCNTLQFMGDHPEEMDAALYWHSYEYRQTGALDETDGVDLNLSDLNSIVIKYYSEKELANNPIATDILSPL